QQAPDAILFFRLGDFYEMFGEDAETAAPILEIALTGRGAGESGKVPMCGVPFHAVDNYLPKLVLAGYKVAICEQMEEAAAGKGIVKREIIRIVSPGTLTEKLPREDDHHYVAAVYGEREREWGLAFADITTGEFTVFQTPFEDVLFTELERIHPAELVIAADLAKKNRRFSLYYCTRCERKNFSKTEPLQVRFPGQHELLATAECAAQAAAGLWNYIQETMCGLDLAHFLEIRTYTSEECMLLDQWTRRNLELTESLRAKDKKGTLFSVLNLTKTAFGARLLRNWLEQPLLREKEILKRLDRVEYLVEDSFLRVDLARLLTGIYDLERLIGKVSYSHINARELLALAQTLEQLPAFRAVLENSSSGRLQEYAALLTGLDDLAELLREAIHPEAPLTVKEGGIIKPGFSVQIDELRQIAAGGKSWLTQLENQERERTGIRSLKIGFNKVFGYYIEITHANTKSVPADYQRKQTLANAERYITPELKAYEHKIMTAEARLIELEYEEYLKLREEVRSRIAVILRAARALAEIDVFVSWAEAAVRYHYVRPQLRHDGVIAVTEGRHPVVEQVLDGEAFVPNDTQLSSEQHLAVITGPNMAGKSTYMRQVALLVLMAHIGSFVPAEKAAISLVDRIFTRVGASDDLAGGQSTFMVEMREVAHILRYATPRSLLIFDEVGRGTSTYDGLSIAWAVAEYLASQKDLKTKTLFATHYHELTQLAEQTPGVFNLHVGVKERGEDIVFLHKILAGGADRSYGIHVARLAGLPPEVLVRARMLLKELEDTATKVRMMGEDQKTAQLTLFEPLPNHPILEEVSLLKLEEMTPRQTLEYLYDLQERLKKTHEF
ncbi:MAG: DNA mismatch repair protein MutS, partial [Peptococcaceae bacterium]|nr:DNA mismatch repair protein MutS [Peptococcaceae bacterium]